MPGRRSERLLAAATPSPAGPGLTRLRISAGIDCAFVVALAALVSEVAMHGTAASGGLTSTSSGSSSAASTLAHAQLLQAAAAHGGAVSGGGASGCARSGASPALSPLSSGSNSGRLAGVNGGSVAAGAALRAAAAAAGFGQASGMGAGPQHAPAQWPPAVAPGSMRRFAPVPSDPFAHATLPLMPAAAPAFAGGSSGLVGLPPGLAAPPQGGGHFTAGGHFMAAGAPLSPTTGPPPGLLLQQPQAQQQLRRAPGTSPMMAQLEQAWLLQALQSQEQAALQHEMHRLTLLQQAAAPAPPQFVARPQFVALSGPTLSPVPGAGGPGPVSQPMLQILSAPGQALSGDPMSWGQEQQGDIAFWSV
jgi:hypothetical protein